MSKESKSKLYVYPENPDSHKWILNGLRDRVMSNELVQVTISKDGKEKSILVFEIDNDFLKALYDFKAGGEDMLQFTEYIEFGEKARKWKLQRPGIVDKAQAMRFIPGMNKKKLEEIIKSGRLSEFIASLRSEEEETGV